MKLANQTIFEKTFQPPQPMTGFDLHLRTIIPFIFVCDHVFCEKV